MAMPEEVHGVAQLGDKIYVAYKTSPNIHMFQSDFQQGHIIELDRDGSTLQDFAACQSSMNLYVARGFAQFGYILRISNGTVRNWIPNRVSDEPISPLAISVYSERLLVTTQGKPSKIILYGSDGQKLQHIQLPQMLQAEHALETSRKTIVVCYSQPQSTVCELNIEGHVMRTYRGADKSLGSPHRLARFDDNQTIVADREHNRVLLLGQNLELRRVLVANVRRPRCLLSAGLQSSPAGC